MVTRHSMHNAMILSLDQPDVWVWQHRPYGTHWRITLTFPPLSLDTSNWRCVPRAWVDDPESVEVRKRLRGGNSEWTRWGIITDEWDHETYKYEIRPRQRTITIPERNVPEPMSEVPEHGIDYFLAQPDYKPWYIAVTWTGSPDDYLYLERGLCHVTRENAIAAAKAMAPWGGE